MNFGVKKFTIKGKGKKEKKNTFKFEFYNLMDLMEQVVIIFSRLISNKISSISYIASLSLHFIQF